MIARTMLDTTPAQLVVSTSTGDMLDTRTHGTMSARDADTLLAGSGWNRVTEWVPEYDLDDGGTLTLVGYTTTVT